METKYVVVYTAYGRLQAETVRLFLESMGIKSFITQESAGTTYGLTVGPLGEAKVLVSAADAEEASKLLEAMEEGQFVENDEEDRSASADQDNETEED